MLLTAIEREEPRRTPGRPWAPGTSGNPNGRRGERKFKGKTLAELARGMTHEALQVVGEVLRMPDVSPALRLQAADIVLRRGWGDAPTRQEVDPASFTYVIQQLVMSDAPCPGVIRTGLPPVNPRMEMVSVDAGEAS